MEYQGGIRVPIDHADTVEDGWGISEIYVKDKDYVGWIRGHINDKSSLGMQRMTRQKHPRARPEDQKDSSGATGGDGWVQSSEGVSGYPNIHVRAH